MAGGVIQLYTYGAEDIYLTGNPQVTFFKTVYRRHTNFSIQTFNTDMLDNPGFNKLSKAKMYRLGDLLSKMYLQIVINPVIPNGTSKFAWVRRLGHALLKRIRVDIGGQILDTQYGEWIDIWYELARKDGTSRGYLKMIGDTPELTAYNNLDKPEYTLTIPLKFWFNRFYGLALPMIAIQYHEVYIIAEFNEKEGLIVSSSDFDGIDQISIQSASIISDYIYLDIEERRRFADSPHEYLIEQILFTGAESLPTPKTRYNLHFNYPTKEIIWAMKNGLFRSNRKFIAYTHTDNWDEEIKRASLELLKASIILLDGPEFLLDQYGNIVVDQYGNHIIIKKGEDPPEEGNWEEIPPLTSKVASNGKITVNNRSPTKSLWLNLDSLSIGDYSITRKIGAIIDITPGGNIFITNLTTDIDGRDISFPIDLLNDTRLFSDDICVNQYSNYGLWITGEHNPLEFALLELNAEERFRKRDGKFFGDLQPYLHHSNTPKDGINLYSFAINPEQHQPSGTSNLSRIERIILTLWFGDSTAVDDLPPIDIFDENSLVFIFGLNYNVLRVRNGLVALAYTD